MNIKIVTSVDSLPNFSTTEPIFSDIETHGLYINIRLIQLYQPNIDDAIYILDLAPMGYDKSLYADNLKLTKEYLKQFHLVFYNASYDLGTLAIVPKKVDDLYYAVKTAYYTFKEFGLDKVTSKLPYTRGLYADIDKKAIQKKGFVLGAYLSSQQIKYSATDVLALAKMWDDTRIQNVLNNNMAYQVDILSLKYAILYEQNGLVVNLEERNKKLIASSNDVERLEQELPAGFNPNSFIQVRAYLNTYKSDHEALVEYALSDRPLADKARVIIDLKRAKKEVSYLESINFPKMYTFFNVAGAATGRFTASGGDREDAFNSQQIPRQFQGLFKADTEDTTVVARDYSTLELRLACAIFNEPYMYQQLIDGRDLHTEMAILASGKKLHPDGVLGSEADVNSTSKEYVTKRDRTTAKSINFGLTILAQVKSIELLGNLRAA